MLAFLYLPIAFLILFSFQVAATPGLPVTGLTLHWYQVLAADTAIQQALLTSVEIAIVVTIVASIIGTMVAFPLVRGGVRAPGTLRLGFTLPIMIPGFLIGIGLLIFFRQALHLQLGLYTVVAGHLVFTIPFVVLIVASRLQGFDRRLEWAAADLGASPWRTLRYIVLPLIAPAILAGALLCVTLSIDEFVITFFTIGPQQTLPLYIYTQIKFGVTPEVNAIATVILVATLSAVVIGSLLLTSSRRLRRRRRGDRRVRRPRPARSAIGPGRPDPDRLPGLEHGYRLVRPHGGRRTDRGPGVLQPLRQRPLHAGPRRRRRSRRRPGWSRVRRLDGARGVGRSDSTPVARDDGLGGGLSQYRAPGQDGDRPRPCQPGPRHARHRGRLA